MNDYLELVRKETVIIFAAYWTEWGKTDETSKGSIAYQPRFELALYERRLAQSLSLETTCLLKIICHINLFRCFPYIPIYSHGVERIQFFLNCYIGVESNWVHSARTRAAVLGSQRLTAWATARPTERLKICTIPGPLFTLCRDYIYVILHSTPCVRFDWTTDKA
jgi:hypothetical protein